MKKIIIISLFISVTSPSLAINFTITNNKGSQVTVSIMDTQEQEIVAGPTLIENEGIANFNLDQGIYDGLVEWTEHNLPESLESQFQITEEEEEFIINQDGSINEAHQALPAQAPAPEIESEEIFEN